jgi:hypothetical protein
MIHYHGTPITPLSVLNTLAGRCFCVSYAAPEQVRHCHDIGQSVMLDNGAFSQWKAGKPTNWPGYYAWAEQWLDFRSTWAVIPDVIDGDVDANDALIREWPHSHRQSAPVWHMHEPIARLLRLCDRWERVCIGSSGEYATVGDDRWHTRMTDAMNQVCGDGPAPVWLHMLRGMALSGSHYPFASVDSTDIARNHSRPQNSARAMADRWDAIQCPARWSWRPVQACMFGGVA